MPLVDMPLDQLEQFRPEIDEPLDFDAFWSSTLAQSVAAGGEVTAVPVEAPLTTVEVQDVTFPGFAGEPIKAWYLSPRGADAGVPVVIEYLGYGGGRGLPWDRLVWASAGYGHLVVDARGQGGSWGSGADTSDPHGSGPAHPGFLTRGILDPADHYYRRLITDAARAIDAVAGLPGADSSRIALTGVSQGGGLAIAAAGLRPEAVRAVMPDVAFLCHIRRGAMISDVDPYREIADYLAVHRGHADQAFRTLSYVDAVNFAKRATAPSLWSVGLMDNCCPPSTTFTAFNWYGDRVPHTPDKRMVTYPFNGHDGGASHHLALELDFARRTLA